MGEKSIVRIQEKTTDPAENLKQLRELEELVYGKSVIRKADQDVSVTAPVYTTLPDWAQPVFGRRIWSFLNYEKNAFAILPKARWLQSGWRMLTSGAFSWDHTGSEVQGGVARGEALPDTVKVTPEVMATQPVEVMHTWGTLEIETFLSSIDDAVAIVPQMRAELGLSHAAAINTMLVQSVEPLAGAATGDWAGTNNFESLDRIVASDAEEDALGGSYAGFYDPWTKYGIKAVDRDSETKYDAVVESASGTMGTDGDLTLWSIDKVWRKVYENGGKTDVILTGADFVAALSEILEPERRFIGEARVVPAYAGVRGLTPGVEAGFSVATYKGIPMVTTRVMRNTDATYGDTISKALFLDTEFLEFRTALPTRYLETSRTYDAFIAQNKLRIEGAYYTSGELVCYRFNVQGKLRDIK